MWTDTDPWSHFHWLGVKMSAFILKLWPFLCVCVCVCLNFLSFYKTMRISVVFLVSLSVLMLWFGKFKWQPYYVSPQVFLNRSKNSKCLTKWLSQVRVSAQSLLSLLTKPLESLHQALWVTRTCQCPCETLSSLKQRLYASQCLMYSHRTQVIV